MIQSGFRVSNSASIRLKVIGWKNLMAQRQSGLCEMACGAATMPPSNWIWPVFAKQLPRS